MNHCYSQGTFGAGQRKQNNYPNSYINVRMDNAKDISTIFHSPYKNGKKNNSFRNPSFLSSDLFYPEQCQKVCTHKNVVENRNQKVYRKMHEERVKKSDHHLKKMYDQSCSARKSEKCLQSRNRASRSQQRKDRTTQLESQLKSLIHYGQKQVTQKKGQRKEEFPIYSVKYRQEIENQQQCRQRRDLEQWMNISQKMKNNKNSIQRQNKKKQTVIMDETIRHNKENVAFKAEKSRVNAEILSNILREQIKQKQRREKSRMKF